MSEACKRIKNWFSHGNRIEPYSHPLLFTDLAWAMAIWSGAEKDEASAGTKRILSVIPEKKHIVFIMIDGMGLEQLVNTLPNGFLNRHRALTLQSVYPSSTPAAMTSLATGEPTNRHGVPTWWIYLEEHNITAEVLPFIERFSRKPLDTLGIAAKKIFELPVLSSKYSIKPATIAPLDIVKSVFSLWARNSMPGVGYGSLEEIPELVLRQRVSLPGRTFVYVYIPEYDKNCHTFGVYSNQSAETLKRIDNTIQDLAKRVDRDTVIVVSADHGLVDLPPENIISLTPDSKIMKYLVVPPAGEPCLPIFHIRPGAKQAFAKAFEETCSGNFILLTATDIESLDLLGPGRLSYTTRRRLGDFVAIAPEPVALFFSPESTTVKPFAAVHGGLTSTEMLVPFILI